MNRRVRYHPRVPREVRDIVSYYTGISERLGDGFWSELTSAIEQARQFPERHHFDSPGRRRSNLTRFPYHFLFQVHPTEIVVTVVRHDSRNPGYGSRRT